MFERARDLQVHAVINGGDMFPFDGDLFNQGDFVTGFLDDHLSKFNSSGIYYLCFPGNDDLKIFDPLFEKICHTYPYIINLAQRKFQIGEYEFIGMNWVVDYPFRLKDRCRMDTKNYTFQKQYGPGLFSGADGWKKIDNWQAYAKTVPTIEDELNRLERPKDFSKSIYVLHMPPAMLGLDHCYDKSRPGSTSIYHFLKKHQPRLSLHGHIHESPEISGKWAIKLGDTVCIQPGQLEELTYVTINLSNMEYHRFKEKSL